MSSVTSYTSSAIVIIGADIYVRRTCPECYGFYLTPQARPESLCCHCQDDPYRGMSADEMESALRKRSRIGKSNTIAARRDKSRKDMRHWREEQKKKERREYMRHYRSATGPRPYDPVAEKKYRAELKKRKAAQAA